MTKKRTKKQINSDINKYTLELQNKGIEINELNVKIHKLNNELSNHKRAVVQSYGNKNRKDILKYSMLDLIAMKQEEEPIIVHDGEYEDYEIYEMENGVLFEMHSDNGRHFFNARALWWNGGAFDSYDIEDDDWLEGEIPDGSWCDQSEIDSHNALIDKVDRFIANKLANKVLEEALAE